MGKMIRKSDRKLKPYEIYELLGLTVIERICEQEGNIKSLSIEHDKKLASLTETDNGPLERQVDIWWEFEQDGKKKCAIIQAKNWKDRVELQHIDTFVSVLQDLPEKPIGIMITCKGFESGPLFVAKKHGIELFILRGEKARLPFCSDEFPEGIIPSMSVDVNQQVIDVIGVSLSVEHSKDEKEESVQKELTRDPNETILVAADGKRATTLSNFAKALCPKEITSGEHEIKQEFKGADCWFVIRENSELRPLKIHALEAKYQVSQTVAEVVESKPGYMKVKLRYAENKSSKEGKVEVAPSFRIKSVVTNTFQPIGDENTFGVSALYMDDSGKIRSFEDNLTVRVEMDLSELQNRSSKKEAQEKKSQDGLQN